jgi:hypothetical protein
MAKAMPYVFVLGSRAVRMHTRALFLSPQGRGKNLKEDVLFFERTE